MEEDTNRVLDLSRKGLKKVPKEEDANNVKCLILDYNELQKIDNIDSYLRIERLSLARNQLLRMYGVCRLHNLRDLNLSYNGILTIEGLKELQHLARLNLVGNNIKTIEHLTTNLRLEYLNLDDNSIMNVGDLSYLRELKELHLNGNRISHLKQCDKYLPVQLETLDLGRNNITDLNEICTLSGLQSLNSIVVADNPCVQVVGPVANGFDYRPFVLNWCMTVQTIDGFAVTPIESLKAEWLYSQGRGRQFRVGEQESLCRYLVSCCPLNGEALESDSERKLRLILSKAQQHQKQLQQEISNPDPMTTTPSHNSPATGRRRGVSHRIQSPRFQSRIGVSARQGSPPDSMISSYHGNTSTSALDSSMQSFQMSTSLIENIKKSSPDVMSQSLDPHVLSNNLRNHAQQQHNNPLVAASKMMPVPESLMSPDCSPAAMHMLHTSTTTAVNKVGNVLRKEQSATSKTMSPKLVRPQQGVRKSATTTSTQATVTSPRKMPSKPVATIPGNRETTSAVSNHQTDNHSSEEDDDDNEEFNEAKLKTIRDRAAQKSQQQSINTIPKSDEKGSAILIQKMWRGYHARKQTRDLVERIHKQRTNEYIKKLTSDMEVTKEALENERKIQQLQMQAINALWKKVSAMQGKDGTEKVTTNGMVEADASGAASFDSVQVVQDLAQTCSLLTNQVQQLQGSMRDILSYISMVSNVPIQQPKPLEEGAANRMGECHSTQTEIVAVHTPQAEQLPFPFQSTKLPRPSTLPLDKKLAEDVNAEEASEENLEKIVRVTVGTTE